MYCGNVYSTNDTPAPACVIVMCPYDTCFIKLG